MYFLLILSDSEWEPHSDHEDGPKKWGGAEFEDGQERGLPVVPGADGVPLSLCILVTSTGNWRSLQAFL